MKLEEITKGALLNGILPGQTVQIITVEPVGSDSLQIYFEKSDRTLGQRIHFHMHETAVDFAVYGNTWSFNALGDKYSLAAEAGKSPGSCRQHTVRGNFKFRKRKQCL